MSAILPLGRSTLRSIVKSDFQVIEGGRLKKQKFLLLQGPIGPFFKNLQDKLNSEGHDAWRVTFNAGDRLYCGTKKTLGYIGKADDLEIWLRSLLQNNQFDVVVLFGSERKVHAIARQICREAGIPVISLEEGYVRPGFITIEEGGNNWNSPIAGQIPSADFTAKPPARRNKAKSSLYTMGAYATRYYLVHGLFSGLNERALFHKPARTRIVKEALSWIGNGIWKQIKLSANANLIENLLEFNDGKYFLVPFQVRDDSQLAPEASLGWTNESLAAYAIDSFAKHANKDHRLVFKVHPLDRGHTDHGKMVRKLAQLHGIEDRVDVLESGSLALILRHSAGLVTINSSSGLSAIVHKRPIALLGRAIYDNPALVTRVRSKSDLDRFWTNARVSSPELSMRYMAWLKAKCLANGDFYCEQEMPVAIDAIVERSLQLITQVKSAAEAPKWAKIVEVKRASGSN